MAHPETLNHMPLDQLVEKAHEEIRRLCIGKGQVGGRGWTMCVPAQAEDSDLLISSALRRQAQAIQDEQAQSGQLRGTMAAMGEAQSRLAEDRNAQARRLQLAREQLSSAGFADDTTPVHVLIGFMQQALSRATSEANRLHAELEKVKATPLSTMTLTSTEAPKVVET